MKTNKRAAITATLVDIRNIGEHKAIAMKLLVPFELATEVIEMFGWPTMVSPVAVAVAKLDLSDAIESADMKTFPKRHLTCIDEESDE